MRRLGLAAIVLVLVSAPSAAWASAQDMANDLSGDIMSPFCPGVTLHECPSAEAIQMRDRIAQWFEQGQTRAEIMQRLEDEYGDGIRANPAVGGIGLGAWLLPAIALVAGLGLASWLLLRWRRAPKETVSVSDIGPGDRRRLEEELAGLRTRR